MAAVQHCWLVLLRCKQLQQERLCRQHAVCILRTLHCTASFQYAAGVGTARNPAQLSLKVLKWHASCRLQYHYEAERVTADERVYYRERPPRLLQVMPHTPQPPAAVLAEEHQALLAAETDCLQVTTQTTRLYAKGKMTALAFCLGGKVTAIAIACVQHLMRP